MIHRLSLWRTLVYRRPTCVCQEFHPCVRNRNEPVEARAAWRGDRSAAGHRWWIR
jgi:hypothetical protein